MRIKKAKQSGFGLVEVMVSIAIMVMVMLALNAVSRSAYNSWENANNKVVAYNLIQEEIETIHNIRDTNAAVATAGSAWDAGIVAKSTATVPGNTKFKKEVKVETLVSPTGIAIGSRKKVTVIITWAEKLGDRSLSGITYITDWKPRY